MRAGASASARRSHFRLTTGLARGPQDPGTARARRLKTLWPPLRARPRNGCRAVGQEAATNGSCCSRSSTPRVEKKPRSPAARVAPSGYQQKRGTRGSTAIMLSHSPGGASVPTETEPTAGSSRTSCLRPGGVSNAPHLGLQQRCRPFKLADHGQPGKRWRECGKHRRPLARHRPAAHPANDLGDHDRCRYRPNSAARLCRTAPPARRSHSRRAIVPTAASRRCLCHGCDGRADRVTVTAGDRRIVGSVQPTGADRRPRARGVAPRRQTNLAPPVTPISF